MKPLIPAIDHTILSPSGRVSKRAREAALKREAARLFPPGFWASSEPTLKEVAEAKAKTLLESARRLRELADRGMNKKRFLKEAAKLEVKAKALDGEGR